MENYKYQSLSFPGGGFVTGFIFHPVEENVLYCRTDIGGVYSFDFVNNSWVSLVDEVTHIEKYKTYPLSIAIDRLNANRLFMSVGDSSCSAIGYSQDYGKSFEYLPTPISEKTGEPVWIHGNAPGRSTGERLIVDSFDSNTLYLGTMRDGLYVTRDLCKTWTRVAVGEFKEQNIAFIKIDESAGEVKGRAKRIIVATSGEKGAVDEHTRGKSVYISNDGGESFEPLPHQPKAKECNTRFFQGFVGQKIAFDDRYMYITYSEYNFSFGGWNSYGCDSGRSTDGAVYRYEISELDNGELDIKGKEITPFSENLAEVLGFGFSGLDVDVNNPGTLIVSTIGSGQDRIYKSVDYGETFVTILSGLEVGEINFNTAYHKPKFNGNRSLIHWMSDLKINPFNSDMHLFTTGAGVYVSENLSENGVIRYKTLNKGMEETVHLNVYAPLTGNVDVIDVIGDYGIILFEDCNKESENTITNSTGDRWITAMNADFSDIYGNVIVGTMRGNWTGETKGGVVISKDGGKTFNNIEYPTGLSNDIAGFIEKVQRPNVTSGWVALSADEKSIVWAMDIPLSANLVVYTHDYGKSYGQTKFFDTKGCEIVELTFPVKIFSDSQNENVYYGFADGFEDNLFISVDKGESFKQIMNNTNLPKVKLAGIDGRQSAEIRRGTLESGLFYIVCNSELWKVKFDVNKLSVEAEKLSFESQKLNRLGLGVSKDGTFNTFYTSGVIDGEYGFFRGDFVNNKIDWVRINDDKHQFGDIRSIDGDKKVYGRFFVATGTRGTVMGTPVE